MSTLRLPRPTADEAAALLEYRAPQGNVRLAGGEVAHGLDSIHFDDDARVKVVEFAKERVS